MRKGSFVPALLFGAALILLFVWFSVFFDLHGAAGGVRRILYYMRVPRTLGISFSGTALGASGYLMQEVLYNILASPSVMGVNAGAGLFALLTVLLFPTVTAARFMLAFPGALLSILLVLLIARRAGYSQSVIVLSGVTVSALTDAAMNGLMAFFPHAVADRQAFTFDGFTDLQYDGLSFSVVFILPGLLMGALPGGGIDFFTPGSEVAQGLGLSAVRHHLSTMVTVTVFIVAAVRTGGLIGSLGLIVPNVLQCFFVGRMSMRQMFTLLGLYDSALSIAADFLARRLLYPYELSVRLLLSLLGASFFVQMLMHRRCDI